MPISPVGTPSRAQAPRKMKKDILLPVACRFLSMDQWMTTYVKRNWGVNEAKTILLARCANPSEPFPPQFIEGLPTQDSQPPLEFSPEREVLDLPSQGPDAGVHAPSASGPSGTQRGPSDQPPAESEQAPPSLQSSFISQYTGDIQIPNSPDAYEDNGQEEPDLPYLRSSPRTRSGSSTSNKSHSQVRNGTLSMSVIGVQSTGPSHGGPVSRREKSAKADPLKQVAYNRYKALLERTGKALDANDYILWRYSTGQMIEGHLTLETACIRPGEMIEIQRRSRHVTLPRSNYTQPFFESNATVYFAKEKDLDATPVPPSIATFSPNRSFPSPLPLPRMPPLPSPALKPKPRFEPREPITSRTAHIIELPPHPDEAGPGSQKQGRGESFLYAEPPPSGRPPEGEQTPRRKPRRSVSAHFTLGSYKAFDSNKEDERDRWKGKEKETGERRVESGLLPPPISDGPFGTSLPGIGVLSTPDRESSKARKAKKKAEKEARETLEHLRNPHNWKDRVVMVQDRVLWVIKEEAGNSQSPLVYSLSDLLSVEEAGIPEGLNAASHSGNAFSKSIRLRFLVNPLDIYGQPQSTTAEKVVVYVYVHIAQATVHEHLLRVLFSSLKGNTLPMTPNPVETGLSLAPIPISSANAASRNISPTDQFTHFPSSDVLHHRSSVSLSSSVSSTQSQSSLGGSDAVHPKKKRSLSRLREKLSRKISSEQRSAMTGSSNATLQRAMTASSETLSSSMGSDAPYLQSPTSSPLNSRRISLMTAMKMGPADKDERRIEPPFILWRERLMKSCAVAGRGEAKLRRTKRGGKSVAHGPWQTDGTGRYYHSFYNSDADDTDPDFPLAQQPTWKPRKRCLDGRINTGGVLDGCGPYSEFEWETWRTDFGFTNAQDYDVSRFGVPQEGSWSPSAIGDAMDRNGRRGSVAALDHRGSPVVSPKGKLVKPSPPSLASPMISIAGSLIPGRSRSQSVMAMSLRSPAASPGPRVPIEPETSLGSPLTPSSSSSFVLPSPSAQFHKPKPVKSLSDFNPSRSRSTTISATSQGGSLTPSTVTQTPHYATPSLSTPIPRSHIHTPQPRVMETATEVHEELQSDDSGKSQVSLRSALSLPGRSGTAGFTPVPPSPALSHAPTSHSRWSQMSEAQMVTAHRLDMGAMMGNTALASARAIATMSGMNPMSDVGLRSLQGQPIGLGLGSSPGPSRDISRTSSPATSAAPSVVSSSGPESSRKKEKFSIAGRILVGRKRGGI
ncbi:hypothetical protein FRC04_009043 [Tulasnella sp. 424]|nr:hypothetical protein FRC04_009043 [Tulasnella sp. 424]